MSDFIDCKNCGERHHYLSNCPSIQRVLQQGKIAKLEAEISTLQTENEKVEAYVKDVESEIVPGEKRPERFTATDILIFLHQRATITAIKQCSEITALETSKAKDFMKPEEFDAEVKEWLKIMYVQSAEIVIRRIMNQRNEHRTLLGEILPHLPEMKMRGGSVSDSGRKYGRYECPLCKEKVTIWGDSAETLPSTIDCTNPYCPAVRAREALKVRK